MSLQLLRNVQEQAGRLISTVGGFVDARRGDRSLQQLLYQTRAQQMRAIQMHISSGIPVTEAMISLQQDPSPLQIVERLGELGRRHGFYRAPRFSVRRHS